MKTLAALFVGVACLGASADVLYTEYTTTPKGTSGARNAVVLPIKWTEVSKIYVKYAYAVKPSQSLFLFTAAKNDEGTAFENLWIGIGSATATSVYGISSFVFTATPGDNYAPGATVHEATMTLASTMDKSVAFGCPWNDGAYASTIDWYALKIYDGSDALLVDLLPAVKDDVAGFFDRVSGNFYERSDATRPAFVAGPEKHAITVAGTPIELGSPDPGYGERGGLTAGENVTATCPATAANAADTIRGTCLGWELEKLDGTKTSDVGTSTGFTYDDSYCCSHLTWKWELRFAVDVRTIVRGRLVGTERHWAATDGSVTLTRPAIPDGCEFAGWYGAGVPDDGRGNESLNLVVAVPQTVYAVFRETGATDVVRFVDYAGGTDDDASAAEAPGSAWKTLAFAVLKAGAGDTIVLARGVQTLTQAITVDKAITVLGDGETDETVLDAGNNAYAMTVSAVGAFFADFAFQRCGNAYSSPMALTLKGNSVFSNVVFRSIGLSQTTGGGNGAHPISASAGLFTHCTFTNNCVPMSYLLDLSGTAAVEDSYIARNATRASSTVGIVSLASADNVLRNCTIVDNTPVNIGAVCANAKAKVVNNLIWGNTDQATGLGANWTVTEANSVNWLANCTTPVAGLPENVGNTDGDPLLQPDRRHFLSDSPCRGAANKAEATATDLDGNPRGDTPSIGAFEYVPPSELIVVVTASAMSSRLPDGIVLSCSIEGSDLSDIAYAWDFDGDGETDSTEASPTLTRTGVSVPRVTVTAGGKSVTAEVAVPLSIHPEGAATYHVDYANGVDDAQHGFSSAAAWKTLQYAVTRDLVVADDVIVLAAGTHMIPAAFTIDKAITVRGAESDGETVLTDGDAGGRLITLSKAVKFESVVFDRYGNNYSSPLVLKVTSAATGAVVSNVVFRRCGTAWPSGGNSSCIFTMSAGLMTHCVITNCQSFYTGAAELGSAATMEDCYLADVASLTRYVLWLSSGATMRNCTVVDNHPTSSAAVSADPNAKVYNCLIWGNTDKTTGVTANWTGATAASGNWLANCTTPVAGLPENVGNTGKDPLLRDDRRHFKSTSPCNGTANRDEATVTDLDGNARGDTPSIGAFEYVDSDEFEVSLGRSSGFARASDGIALSAEIVGTCAEPLTYSWDYEGDGREDSSDVSPTITAIGMYRPVLTVTDANKKTASATFEETLTVHADGVATYFVDDVHGVNDAQHGRSAASAWKTLQYAVTRDLVASNDTIVLAKGTHVIPAAFTIDKAIAVRGEGSPAETVLTDGDTGSRAITVAAAAKLDSFMFYRYGNNYSTPLALKVSSSAKGAVVSNVVFSTCGITTATDGNSSSIATVNAGLFTHCIITNCQGFYNASVSLGSAATMENCLIANNKCQAREIMRITGGSTTRNCTIVDNRPRGAAAVVADANAKVRNCIVWSNVDWQTGVTNNWSDATAASGNWTSTCTAPVTGLPENVGNIEADPLFSAKRPYHLEKDSPCRNKGDDSVVAPGETDLDGNPRRYGRKVDMGCYELQGGAGLMLLVR